MPRIAGIDIPAKKRIIIALTYIYGIGRETAQEILTKAQIDPNLRADALDDAQVSKIREVIESGFRVEGDRRKEVSMNIKRLIDLGAYRGIRHRTKLPVRGQRTHTNARTRKGKVKVAIAGKKKAPTAK